MFADRASNRIARARRLAVLLGMANAGVTAYWLAGGTALLDTVGGDIERWGRRRDATVLVALAIVLIVKVAVSVVPVVADRIHPERPRRVVRLVGWAAASTLVAYGGVLTLVGLLLQLGVIEPSVDADETALAWHTYLWDPWFLVWGVALGAWLRLSGLGGARRPDVSESGESWPNRSS